ncbi:MAG: sigma-54 dependent transcriptional regulator [Deltaproteobacteria bacterium]|nr:sigma-54 dependent transcriptional regulator [Deltaproteobacteria bacterium]
MKPLLVVSEKKEAHIQIRNSFRGKYRVETTSQVQKGLEMLRSKHYDFVFVDVEFLDELSGGQGYKEALKPFWIAFPDVEVIVMAPQEQIRDAVMAVKAGAGNYITYPLDNAEVRYVTETLYESSVMQWELNYLRDAVRESDSVDFLRTRSPLMKKVYEQAQAVAPTRSTVLIVGETGTGKGVLAKLLYRYSKRRDRPFISVHCGVIPDTLLESELFGHEKGAFTGAVRRQLGKFEVAKGGTIFLDEIGTITPSAQIKLLQILQDGIFQRIGGEETIEADVRVIAATNTDLREMCDAGTFRTDLYYRLNVFPIEIPPLRERAEDMEQLIEVFLARLNKFSPRNIRAVHPEVLEAFKKYHWPGNIRELQNLIERAYIIEKSPVLTKESFPGELFDASVSHAPVAPLDITLTLAEVRRNALDDIERSYLKQLLTAHRGRIKDTARRAGVSNRQLFTLMKRLGLRKEEFK